MSGHMIEGQLPPSSVDLEQAVLGACLLERSGVAMVADILSEEMLYEERHRVIFSAIMQLYRGGDPVDLLTVSTLLLKQKKLEVAGSAHYIGTLSNKVASSANVQYHARIIVQNWMKREVIVMANNLLNKAWDPSEDVFDLLGAASLHIQSIHDRAEVRDAESAADMRGVIDMDPSATYVSGMGGLDKRISNRRGKMIVVGARPGVGKSLFGMWWAYGMAQHGPGLFLSLEMDADELRARLACGLGGIPISRVMEGRASEHEQNAVFKVSTDHHERLSKVLIDPTSDLTPSALMSKIERAVVRDGAKWAVVDYLQLIDQERGTKRLSEYERVTEASRAVNRIAKRLDIPILALSQLRRKEGGGNDRPKIQDLRSSGQIEQDAYSIILLHRDGYETYPPPEHDALNCIIAKNRNGSLENVVLDFYGPYGQIGPYVSQIQPPTSYIPPKSSAGTRTDDDGDLAPF